MSRNTTRRNDWGRFWRAIAGRHEGRLRHSNPVVHYVLAVGHTGKNIIVEEGRRWDLW
jgi:hypothetical protein